MKCPVCLRLLVKMSSTSIEICVLHYLCSVPTTWINKWLFCCTVEAQSFREVCGQPLLQNFSDFLVDIVQQRLLWQRVFRNCSSYRVQLKPVQSVSFSAQKISKVLQVFIVDVFSSKPAQSCELPCFDIELRKHGMLAFVSSFCEGFGKNS